MSPFEYAGGLISIVVGNAAMAVCSQYSSGLISLGFSDLPSFSILG